ncbi:zinc ribbon-containing protein [Colwellia sp. 1_MG-2023]|jgi:DNA phosphorothioation-dependent restriction protein DptG|uniref:zinc ribbon-containing protein n=1 Tax=unclassified Colwellia TaxID=196834 RepID=UPI001C08CBD1|nr:MULTISPECIES: zinc ribbon-containing protein [unclassified Colwellia]MBU2923878.1 zinc ribbon-containing protein [Colwellia sp. C2M11]MDO6488807.1 zinc ribbon-containing protein [Colwellia sp. 6_MG-2023]MDO6653050.1 zinc ribbon-containing protein [Colwellia sp. 3_MG-2023]MDO6665963.1 zinc ribbon-containing protein [Colwellia sp. 2_MG-2023]MDO6690336.1 zinc ribbon-containing protein [Colwellia sp. 1_MG-2023]
MANQKDYLVEIYQDLSNWLEEMTESQKPKVIELVKQAKLYAKAAEEMSEEKVNQFTDNLKHDLHDFYLQNQSEAKDSTYLGLLNETLWSTLAQLTDKSQVEWAELVEDFEHDGLYKVGDFIGFGELACQQCGDKQHIVHFSEVTECVKCGGDSFTRLPLDP